MRALQDLVEVIARLRGPGGCPWDRQQTHASLKRYLIEECYEALEAIDARDPKRLSDELGDVLIQVLLHAQIAAERGDFDIEDIAQGTVRKLRHRHPHVFGDVQVRDADEVIVNWERLKHQEPVNRGRESLLDGVPEALPALLRALKTQKRAARVGFDWEDVTGPLEKVDEELRRDIAEGKDAADEVGDLLFAVVNVARFLDVDPEDALRATVRKFRERFACIEAAARRQGRAIEEMTVEEMDAVWDRTKSSAESE
ncbi:MAG: nucleoside triphosphate pyrophosphohydrolase [Armatimonadota bacterium]